MTAQTPTDQNSTDRNVSVDDLHPDSIAIVGMACRFPGAADVEAFWRLLVEGREAITFFSDDELKEAGVDPVHFERDNYVKAGATLDDVESFDAGYFDYPAREAVTLDPQQRIFLEVAQTALESSCHAPETFDGLIGVFAGGAQNSYYARNLAADPMLLTTPEGFQAHLGNDKDYLATRVAYKLNLSGPAVTVQTACSTSLAAVHLAAQSLLAGECDLALAGGVSVKVPHRVGYFHQDGMPFSADGHCRPFDATASGTIFGSGAGAVVLRRLEDALRDGDPIDAVLRGSAMNNDGSLKIGFTAPSIDGQSKVIAEALAVARVDPRTIGHVEAHGTATPLGDPIEVDALIRSFDVDEKGFCALGSVKSNVGHLETAAGVAGLIKSVLMLSRRVLVPSLHFESPNPEIPFDESPFFVSRETRPWDRDGAPRRAGVSSFGIGGTNVHTVLEEAPAVAEDPAAEAGPQVLTLSAKTPTALDALTAALAEQLAADEELDLAAVAQTTRVGRRSLPCRRILVAENKAEAVDALKNLDPKRVFTFQAPRSGRSAAFLFPGGGSQYVDMGRQLYAREPVFRQTLDHCFELLRPLMDVDPHQVLYPSADHRDQAVAQLKETPIALPILFSAEYALARLLISWGIEPAAMIGHSNGEFVAATLAGVFTLEQALDVVARRAALMTRLPKGSMLSLPLPVEEVREMVGDDYSIAAVNSPVSCVVSGTVEQIDALEEKLASRELDTRRLHIAVGAHSKMADGIVDDLVAIVAEHDLNEPTIPFVSNVTGDWIQPGEATDPAYWGRHLRHTVRFQEAIGRLMEDPTRILIEVGPGQALGSLARQNLTTGENRTLLATTRQRHDEEVSDSVLLAENVAKVWLVGGAVDWRAVYEEQGPRRARVVTYPFERRRYWIEAQKSDAGSGDLAARMQTWMEAEGKVLDQEKSGDDRAGPGGLCGPARRHGGASGRRLAPILRYRPGGRARQLLRAGRHLPAGHSIGQQPAENFQGGARCTHLYALRHRGRAVRDLGPSARRGRDGPSHGGARSLGADE